MYNETTTDVPLRPNDNRGFSRIEQTHFLTGAGVLILQLRFKSKLSDAPFPSNPHLNWIEYMTSAQKVREFEPLRVQVTDYQRLV
jgi:hypothetical protein